MNWRNYEEIVRSIYEKLGSRSGVKILCSGQDCKVTGRSGVEHQVDVLTEHSDGLHSYRTAIECKFWDRRRPKDDVMKLRAILEDAGLQKGVIVSKLGFTPDAIATARYAHIELVELREPTPDDWKGRIKDIAFNIHMTVPEPYDFRLDILDSGVATETLSSENIDSSTLTIQQPGLPQVTAVELINQMISSANRAATEPQLLRREFPTGTTSSALFGDAVCGVVALQFQLRFHHHTETKVLAGADHVAMIMKSIFNRRRIVITPNGDVRESDP